MKHFLIVFVVVATAAAVPIDDRIFGGKDASPGQFPFIVALNDPLQFCDGSIINKNWILTAAHCLDGLAPSTTVVVGTTTADAGGTTFKILKYIQHEGFNYDTVQDDIGLIQIDGELEYDDLVQPIEFGDPEGNATCVAVGWGITETVDYPPLQYVELTAIDLNSCERILEGLLDGAYLGPEQTCAVGPEGKGACYGDSGGPLVCDGKLSGIVSFGVSSDCAIGYPDIYTKPSAYADWIQSHIQN